MSGHHQPVKRHHQPMSRLHRRVGGALAAAAAVLASATPCAADTIELPPAQSDQLGGAELFQALGSARDQLPGYLAPGAISNDELVEVQVAGDGTAERVTDHQRIRITGSGDYLIREAGPVLAASAGRDDPPVLNLGDVLWQGFSTGSRQLAAELTLDPQIESSHLPLRLSVTFTAATGPPVTVAPSGQLPGAGTVTVTLTNTSAQRTTLPSARDVTARSVATALDRLARTSTGTRRLLTSRTGLPSELQVTAATARQATEVMPLRIRGTIAVSGPQTSGGRSSAIRLDTIVTGSSRFVLPIAGPGIVALDLSALPTLDERVLRPPRGFSSWSAWAAAAPPVAERRSALDTLVQSAANGSRASSYSPYLGSELPPAGQTAFHFTLSTKDDLDRSRPPLTPRPLPISLAVLAGLLLAGGATVLWRRS
jgi:hypothetical protein